MHESGDNYLDLFRPEKGVATKREVSYRFRVNGNNPESGLCNLFSVNFRGVGHDAGVTG